jgi:signal transduction histidine kinase
MNRHGGTAAITSSPDGTEVRLRLPVAAASAGTAAAAAINANGEAKP